MTKFVSDSLFGKNKAIKIAKRLSAIFFLLRFKFAAYASFPWKLDRDSYGVPFGVSTSVNSETMLFTSGLVKVVDF